MTELKVTQTWAPNPCHTNTLKKKERKKESITIHFFLSRRISQVKAISRRKSKTTTTATKQNAFETSGQNCLKLVRLGQPPQTEPGSQL